MNNNKANHAVTNNTKAKQVAMNNNTVNQAVMNLITKLKAANNNTARNQVITKLAPYSETMLSPLVIKFLSNKNKKNMISKYNQIKKQEKNVRNQKAKDKIIERQIALTSENSQKITNLIEKFRASKNKNVRMQLLDEIATLYQSVRYAVILARLNEKQTDYIYKRILPAGSTKENINRAYIINFQK